MAISLSVKTDIDRLTRYLDDAARNQIPFATALALTRTAQQVPRAAGDQMKRDLDNPKPFTTGRSAFYLQMARKNNLKAEVGFKDIQANYMQWQIAGGSRTQKPYETVLRGMGILPSGYVTVPGRGVKLDRYGNVTRADIAKTISWLAAGGTQVRGRGARTRDERLFVVSPNQDLRTRHLAPGIYRTGRRQGSARYAIASENFLHAVLLFVSDSDYKTQFDFKKLGDGVVSDYFSDEFKRQLNRALRPKKR